MFGLDLDGIAETGKSISTGFDQMIQLLTEIRDSNAAIQKLLEERAHVGSND